MMVPENIKEHLQSLVSKPIQNWDELGQYLTQKKLKKGEHFFQHLDKTNEVAIVSSGLFRIYLIDSDGEERTFSFIPENGFILDAFLSWDNSQTMVSCQAIEESEIYTIKYDVFLNLMAHNNVWHEVYREVLLKNYRKKTRREIDFVLHNAKERLKHSMQSNAFDMSRVPKAYLASYLGIAPPSLSRLLREIKEETNE